MSRKSEPPNRQRTLAQEMLVPGLVFGGAIVIALLVILFGDKIAGGDSNADAARSGSEISADMERRLRSEFDQVGVAMGPADAPVVIREFADYQCPACGAFEPTAERLRKQYAGNDKVRFVFFDFPLPMHAHAREAAAAARCAARQDAFWTYHDKLYATQRRWSDEDDPTGTFLDLAVESGIRLKPFEQCIQQGATDQIVARSADIARKIRVIATPTVLIGRRVFSGVKNYETLAAEVENQLRAVRP